MSTKAFSIAFVVLLLLSLIPPMASSMEESGADRGLPEERLFSGFFVGSNAEVWNQTSYPATAVPEAVSYTHLTLPTT